MNESLDLRNRILKMRESNNVVLSQAKSEIKTTDTATTIIPQKTQNVVISSEVNFDTKLKKENSPLEDKKIENSNNKNVQNPIKQASDNLAYDNEAQFRMIAKKFNEAVEVILELSDKVKNLEETINSLSVKSSKNKKNYSFFNLKTYVFITITTLIVLVLFTFPINLTLIKLIITDIISSI